MFTKEYYAVCDCHNRHDTHDQDPESAKKWLLRWGWTINDKNEATCPECSVKALKIGDKVTYMGKSERQHGVLKSQCEEFTVFVVYHCNGEWDKFQNYTGENTNIDDLIVGWRDENFKILT